MTGDQWDSAWISVQFTSVDARKVAFLYWYAELDGDLVILAAGDDPVLTRINAGDSAAVAAVRNRGQRLGDRRYVPATVAILDSTRSDAVGAALDRKYRWRRRIFRLPFWIVRRLGGTRRQRVDVPIRIVVAPDPAHG